MTTKHDDTAPAALAANPSPDAFSTVMTLLALLVDPKACRARIADLQKHIAAADKAQANLAADRAEHQATMARERAAIEADKRASAARWAELNRRQYELDQQAEMHADTRAALDRLTGRRIEMLPGGGGGARSFSPDSDDARQVEDTAFESDQNNLPMPARPMLSRRGEKRLRARGEFPAGVTLTREPG
jgi:hypothetical protein